MVYAKVKAVHAQCAIRVAADFFDSLRILGLVQSGDIQRHAGVVVNIPVMETGEEFVERLYSGQNPDFNTFPDLEEWLDTCEKIARGKAALTVRTGLSSRLVQHAYPQLLQPGDVLYPGSVSLDGIIVAVSGVQDEWDEAIAMVIAQTIRSLAMADMRLQRPALGERGIHFLE